jgi:hypothetical protein
MSDGVERLGIKSRYVFNGKGDGTAEKETA